MLGQSTLLRLETQPEVIPLLLSGATPEAIMARPASGPWAAPQKPSPFGPPPTVFLERLRRILGESAPQLGRYRAEEDSAWPEWSCLSTEEVLSRHKAGRAEFIRFGKGLSHTDARRIGIHPLLGEMSLAFWVEFFLLHEAHHLYVVMTRLGQAKRS